MRPYAWIAYLGVAAGLNAGCASAPPFRFYTLSPAVAAAASASSPLVVALGPVTVPAAVDRPEIVVGAGANEVRLDDFNRWVSPLQDNLSRALAEDLARLLGSPRVMLLPLPPGAQADYRVAVDIRTFDSTLGDSAVLDAVWTVRRAKDEHLQTGTTHAREATNGPGYPALAGAHSRAVAALGRDIAQAVEALQREAPQPAGH